MTHGIIEIVLKKYLDLGIIEIVQKKYLDVSYFKAEHLLVVLTLFVSTELVNCTLLYNLQMSVIQILSEHSYK